MNSNNSFWHNFFFNNVIQSKKNHTSPKKTFLSSKKEQQAFFVVFCVFFSLHCGQKLEYFFFNFLSTEFIVRHFVAHQGRGVGIIIIIIIIIIELQGDIIIFFLLFLKLNMLWMAFSIFFVKYVFVVGFFFQKKKNLVVCWGSGDWLKNQN